MKKSLIAFLIMTIAISLLISNATALEAICAEYPSGAGDSDTGSTWNTPHPSSSSSTSAFGQSFKTSLNGTLLTQVDVTLKKVGNPVAFYRCSLFLGTGTYGSTGTPTGDSVADSVEDYQVSTLGLTYGPVSFNFSGTYPLIADTVYWIVLLEVNETTADTSNRIAWNYDTVGSYSGNVAYYSLSSWTVPAVDDDLIFTVWGDGGDLVTYVGGDIYYDTESTFYNVTAGTADVALTVQSPPQDIMFYALLALTFACIILMLKSGIPLINFVFGVMTLGIATYSLTNTDIIFFGYIQMFAVLMATLCMLLGYRSYRND